MPDIEDEKWMSRALDLARRSYDAGEVPVGAVVVMEGKVVGEGWNQPINTCDPTAHAEIVAIRQAAIECHNYRLPGTSLYVTIEPCTMCLGAIIHARVARVIFGALEPKAGALESHPDILTSGVYNHSFEWKAGICKKECAQIIQDFFCQRRAENRGRRML